MVARHFSCPSPKLAKPEPVTVTAVETPQGPPTGLTFWTRTEATLYSTKFMSAFANFCGSNVSPLRDTVTAHLTPISPPIPDPGDEQ
jgi:hypothetical protein